MPRIQPVNYAQTTGETKQMLDAVQANFGIVPNLIRIFANSPATLGFYLNASSALGKSHLGGKLRELIDLAVSEVNDCQYCLSAHATIVKNFGVTDEQINEARRGKATDPKTQAALQFAQAIVINRGRVSDQHLATVREAGFTEGQITEIIAAVALKVFTNYFSHIADPEIDFPHVQPLYSEINNSK